MRKKTVLFLAVILLGRSLKVMAEEPPKDILYNVSFPTDIRAHLDPGNLSGRGQVFSDCYTVENYGNRDVAIKIKNIELYDADSHSKVKETVDVDMVWKNEAEQMETVLHVAEGIQDEYVLFLAAAEYGRCSEFLSLRENSSGFFYFTGTFHSDADIVEEDGKMTARFDYEIVHVGDGETEGNSYEPTAEAWEDLEENRESSESAEMGTMGEAETIAETGTMGEVESPGELGGDEIAGQIESVAAEKAADQDKRGTEPEEMTGEAAKSETHGTETEGMSEEETDGMPSTDL